MLNNDITYTYTCYQDDCGKQFDHTVKLDEEFNDLIYNFKRQTETYELTDKVGHIWKFKLTNFAMNDYLYFRYFMDRLQDADEDSPEIVYETKFVRPILYIKEIYLNDEIIEDWNELLLPDKLAFWNKIPPEITINDLGTNNNTLYNFISKTFIEEQLLKHIDNIKVTCPHCGMEYGGMYSFDNFFMF